MPLINSRNGGHWWGLASSLRGLCGGMVWYAVNQEIRFLVATRHPSLIAISEGTSRGVITGGSWK